MALGWAYAIFYELDDERPDPIDDDERRFDAWFAILLGWALVPIFVVFLAYETITGREIEPE